MRLLYLGRGHTEGDVVVYLPQEKAIITGDLLAGWAPSMGDAYPYDWMQTLGQIQQLDWDFAIGGHGSLLSGKVTCQLWIDYLSALMAATERVSTGEATLEDVKAQVIPILTSQFADRFSPKFLYRVEGNVEKAFAVVHESH